MTKNDIDIFTQYNTVNDSLSCIQFISRSSRKKKYKHVLCCQNAMSFDVETSSGYLKDGKIIQFDRSKPPEFWEDYEKVGIVYIWQFAIDDKVYYGRTIDSLIVFLDELEALTPNTMKFVYVHNLGFEFQAIIREYFKIKTLFARKERHPLTVTLEDYNIEFRCSYQLTNLSLGLCVKEYRLNTPKLDTLDYEVIRTPFTKLSPEELQYTFNDVLIVNEIIDKYKQEYGKIESIPLTQTGEIRLEVKNVLKDNIKWWKLVKALNDLSYKDYLQMLVLLTGGSVHANRLYAGRLITEHIKCADFSSDYPWQMLEHKYPMSLFITADYDKKYEDSDKYSYIIHYRFINLKCIKFNPYLSESKAVSCIKGVADNGKLMEADECEYVLTNIDMNIVRQCYTWDSIESKILDFKFAMNDYLPDELCRLILELYVDKTTLKGVDDMNDLYLKKKQKLNSCYGMAVTKIYNDRVKFNNDTWDSDNFSEELYNELKAENDKKYQPAVLPFAVGIFVTSFARAEIWQNLILPNDDLVNYYDTDSVYYYDDQVQESIDRYNATIPERHKQVADRIGVDVAMLSPADQKGVKHPLGILDFDGEYSQGVYLGAKRYALNKIIAKGDNFIITKMKQTVAGVRKGSVDVLENNLENFRDGLVYDYDDAQKLIMTYKEDQQAGIVWNKGCYDEYISTNQHACNMMPTRFTLGLADNYKKLLDKVFADNNNFMDAKKLYKEEMKK